VHQLGGPVCVDIDECVEGHNCRHPTRCVNTEGSYECRCKPDWAPDGNGGCVNVACSFHKCGQNEVCQPVIDNPDISHHCDCTPLFKRGPNGFCVPDPASFHNLPPPTIKQCQSLTLNVPSLSVAADVDLFLSAPHQLYGLYVKEMTPVNQPHLIQINMTDKYGRSTTFPVPVHVENLNECAVQESQWTADPMKLKQPELGYFHESCRPNCHKLCDPRFPNCAVCVDTPGSYKCECGKGWRMERAPDGSLMCIDNEPPVVQIDPRPYNETICFDCSQFSRPEGEDPSSSSTCAAYLEKLQHLECIVYDNFDPPSPTCERSCEVVDKEKNIDGIIYKTFDIIYGATDTAGNRAMPVRKRVNLKVVDLRNTVNQLRRLSEIDSSVDRVTREYESLEKTALIVLSLLLGAFIALLFAYGRRVVNMLAYLAGAGMSYPAFEEGGNLWLSISRWWWTENERRQFILTQWALKRE